MASLKEENLDLKRKMKDPNTKIMKSDSSTEESTFITKGSENPSVVCDNW